MRGTDGIVAAFLDAGSLIRGKRRGRGKGSQAGSGMESGPEIFTTSNYSFECTIQPFSLTFP